MENNSQSPAQFTTQSSKSESQMLEFLGSAPVVVGVSFKNLVEKVGMSRAIKSVFVRWRYILNLWILREIYLWRGLNHCLKDIPQHTKEYRLLTFVNKHPYILTLVLKLENRCLKRITCNPLKPSLTVNKNN